MQYENKNNFFLNILNEIKHKITEEIFQEIKEDVKGNLKIGFSVLCTFLSNFQIQISNEYYEKLKYCNEILDFPVSDISFLKKLSDSNFKSIDYKEYINTILNLLNEMKHKINIQSIKTIEEQVNHYEWGLAFEILCEYLDCNTIPITNKYYEKLISYNSLMGSPKENILHLKSLTKLKTLIEIINEIKTKLSNSDLKNINEYIAVDDWKSAFEMLCACIFDLKTLVITQQYYDQLVEYAKLVHIPETEIFSLKKAIR